MYKNLHINHIVAMSQNRVIGRGGGMPWHISEDFKFFKSTTMGCPIIMGRKTWESIGRALPGRQTIVVSRALDAKFPDNVVSVKSIDGALEWCDQHQSEWGTKVFIVGGGELYRQTLAICDSIYLTKVDAVVDGDTYYPKFSQDEFHLKTSTRVESTTPPITFHLYERYPQVETVPRT